MFELVTTSYAAEGYNLRDDWFGSRVRKAESRKERLEEDAIEIGLDIHHIFPRKWCTDQKTIDRGRYESILNKTQISYKANRKIGGDAPSLYLPRIQSEKQVALDNAAMNDLLASHALSPELLRADVFDSFLEDRRRRLSRLVEKAMGKPVVKIAVAAD